MLKTLLQMNKKILKNCRIVDPSQKMDEIGNIIINENGKIEDIGQTPKYQINLV